MEKSAARMNCPHGHDRMKKVYFPQNGGNRTEQNLVQDLVDEQIKLFGADVFYIPRINIKDKTLG